MRAPHLGRRGRPVPGTGHPKWDHDLAALPSERSGRRLTGFWRDSHSQATWMVRGGVTRFCRFDRTGRPWGRGWGLAVASTFRFPNPIPPGINQGMVNNPNSVLTAAIVGQTITQTTVLIIDTRAPAVPPPPAAPNTGGGTDNIAFLQGGAAGPNAVAAQMRAVFWIEHVAAGDYGPAFLQLQYTQTVLLNFNGLSWPHVSVATLRKR